MDNSIIVFIKGKWIVKPLSSKSMAWVGVWGGWPPEHRFEKLIPSEDSSALKVAREVAREYGLKLEVRDLASLKGWISARINKVKNTPTIIINNQRIVGVPDKDDLVEIIRNIDS